MEDPEGYYGQDDYTAYDNTHEYDQNYPPLPPSPTHSLYVEDDSALAAPRSPHRASRKHQTALPFLSTPSLEAGEDEGTEQAWDDSYLQQPKPPPKAARNSRRRVETAPSGPGDSAPRAGSGRGLRAVPPPRRPPRAPQPRPPTIRLVNSQLVETRKLSHAVAGGAPQQPQSQQPQQQKPQASLPDYAPRASNGFSYTAPAECGQPLYPQQRRPAPRPPLPQSFQQQDQQIQQTNQHNQTRGIPGPASQPVQLPPRYQNNNNAMNQNVAPVPTQRPVPPPKLQPQLPPQPHQQDPSHHSAPAPHLQRSVTAPAVFERHAQQHQQQQPGPGQTRMHRVGSESPKPEAHNTALSRPYPGTLGRSGPPTLPPGSGSGGVPTSSKIALLQSTLTVPKPYPGRRPARPPIQAGGQPVPSLFPVNGEKEKEKGAEEGEKEQEKDTGCYVLELFCLDVSGSMWKSNNTLKWFGKSRFAAAKELILRPAKVEDEVAITEKYSGLLKFDKSVQEVIPCGKHDQQQQMRFAEQINKIQPGKGTALYSAIKKCDETIEEFFKSRGTVDRSNWKVVLHLLTDARDNSSDPMSAKEFSEYKMNRHKLDVQHNFLYSFNNDYETSKEMADVFDVQGLIMIDNNEVDEARKKRDKLIFAALQANPKMQERKAREYKDPSGPEGFCYSMGDIPDLVLTEKFLKKVAIVFQSETFLKEQGIFRISGSLVNVDAIVEQFLAGDTYMESLRNPHEVAHAVKNALKRSHTLIPHNYREQLLQIYTETETLPVNERIEALQPVLNNIGPRNYECLRLLMLILSRVNEYAQFNDMNATNLATIFAPILLPQVFAGPPSQEEYGFLSLLIVHFHSIFVEDS